MCYINMIIYPANATSLHNVLFIHQNPRHFLCTSLAMWLHRLGSVFMPAYSTRGCMRHSLRYHEQLQLGAHVKWCYADELVPYGYGSDQLFAPFYSFDTFLLLSLSLPFKTSRSFLVVTWMFPVKCCALLNKAEIKFWWSIVLCFCQSSVQTVSIA